MEDSVFKTTDSGDALVGHITTVGRLQTAEMSALRRGAKARNDSFVNLTSYCSSLTAVNWFNTKLNWLRLSSIHNFFPNTYDT